MTVALSIVAFTRNFIIMLLTTLCVVSTVVSLLGCFVLWGWAFGAVEAVSISLICGMSVDYVLHVGHSYASSRMYDANGNAVPRKIRAKEALLAIGTPVAAASLTTILSMCVLCFSSTLLFFQIGVIVTVTLAIGAFLSFGPFLAALMIIGPEGECGGFGSCFKCLRKSRGDARYAGVLAGIQQGYSI
jgi:5-methyltetrahydrofolate--homocysteine methyltransferase